MSVAECPGGSSNPHADKARFPLPVRSDILALKPHDLEVTEAMIRAVEAHVAAPPKAGLREIAELAGVPEQTLRSWLYRRRGYGQWLCTVLMTMQAHVVPRVWRAVIAKALDGSERAAHMVLIRFDLGYREAQGKPIPKSMKQPTIDSETLKRADAILAQGDLIPDRMKSGKGTGGGEVEGGRGGDGAA